ncbi:MAG: hypothetical protein VX069_06885 [Cyanobacteriota bacterium]|nr:hypothetical protein [Cyanobacteriota bacterium]
MLLLKGNISGLSLIARNDNLRGFDANEEQENRPFRIGLHDRVRLLRLVCCGNRMDVQAVASHHQSLKLAA